MRQVLSLLVLVTLGGCQSGFVEASREFGPAVPARAPRHPVEIHRPKTLGVLDTDLTDPRGTPVGVSCRTCHDSTSTGPALADGGPKGFHRGLTITHGGMDCKSCHDADRSRLHLADGRQLAFDQTMTLCAQCHGVQYRDYTRGSHGGMNGYWDLRRGGRERNHCVDCHSPHTPAYERVRPVHPPQDRFLDWKSQGGTHARH